MKSEQEAVLKHFKGHTPPPARFQPARDRAGERRFVRDALNCLSEEERRTAFELVGMARNGNEEAKNALCEILEDKLKAPIKEAFRRKGVTCQDWDSGRHDLIVLVRERIKQVRVPEKAFSWIFRVLQGVARRHRPRYLKLFRPEQEMHEKKQQLEEIGRKWISVLGKLHKVDIVAPFSHGQLLSRQPVLLPLSDSMLMNGFVDNHTAVARQLVETQDPSQASCSGAWVGELPSDEADLFQPIA